MRSSDNGARQTFARRRLIWLEAKPAIVKYDKYDAILHFFHLTHPGSMLPSCLDPIGVMTR